MPSIRSAFTFNFQILLQNNLKPDCVDEDVYRKTENTGEDKTSTANHNQVTPTFNSNKKARFIAEVSYTRPTNISKLSILNIFFYLS
jgi:hypothetical protein